MYFGKRKFLTNVAVLGPGFDPAAATYFSTVAAAGGTISAARKAVYNTLFASLRSGGLLSLLDRLWLHAAEDTFAALIDLVGLQTATAVNTPTFTADQGYAGNATTSYVNTNFVPSTAGGLYTQNSASYGVYTRTNRTLGADKAAMGASGNTTFWPKLSDNNIYYYINRAAGGTAAGPSTVAGMWALTRNGTAQIAYQNGAQFVADTGASGAISAFSFVVCGSRNGAGAIAELTNDQQAASFIGGTLTAGQVASLSSAVNAYMTSLGTNVY